LPAAGIDALEEMIKVPEMVAECTACRGGVQWWMIRGGVIPA
jgi:hypothetical protein